MAKADKAKQADAEAESRTSKSTGADQADWHWTDPKTLKINPAFQSLIPLQSRGEYKALEQSIQAEGCRDPLTIWQGRNIVLDGHTRRDLCIGHKQQVKVREIALPDEHAAVQYILQIQRQRRNLTREAMSYFRGVEYNAVKQQHGGNRRGRKSRGQSDLLKSTARQLAEKYGVSEKTIKRDGVFAKVIDKIVADYDDPEIKRKLLGADVKMTHGTARVLLRLPSEERKAAVDQLIAQGELPRAKNAGSTTAPRPKAVAQSIVDRLSKRGEGHARSVLQQMARLLGMEVSEKSADK
jgi:hypothetical protein